MFVLHSPDHIHLAYNSPCKDVENTNLTYDGQVDIDNEDRVYGTNVDMGADEIYSCDVVLSEDDITLPLDKNMDVFINFPDYALFAQAWLSADPNYPLCDPNNAGYVSDPEDPDYISEDDKLRYDSEWDLDSDLFIGMADLALFADIWLLVPCWMESQMNRYEMMGMAMGGGESAMMMPMPMESSSALQSFEPEPVFPTETDLAEFILGVNEIIDFMDAAMEENPSDSERLLEIRADLEAILEDLWDSILVK